MNLIPLFCHGDLSATLEAQLAEARRAVDEIPETQFRAADMSATGNKLFTRFGVEPVSITEGAISVQAEDADIDRRSVPDRDWGFPGDPPTVRGTRVIYNVPFTGDAAVLRKRPSTWTQRVPRAVITDSELRFVYEVQSSQVASTKASFDCDLSDTKQWLGWANDDLEQFNTKLAAVIEEGINQRNSRLQAASEGLAGLGLPVRRSERVRIDAHLIPAPRSAAPASAPTGRPEYDVALSFAGEDRRYVQKVATYLVEAKAKVFYDEFETVALWGKDLVEHLQDIYENRARFCVLFISEHYVKKPWPTHERRSAQARALVAKEEYLLPARFDDSVVPGLPSTMGFVDLRPLGPRDFAELVLAKIGMSNSGA